MITALLLPAALASLVAAAGTDAGTQGWAGPGWYVSSDAPASADPALGPAFILFDGPHGDFASCQALYTRLYSPIGACRYVTLKPGLHRAT